jgi:hypothetical protein
MPLIRFLDYSNPTTIGQVDAAIRAARASGVCHYMSGNFARRLEQTDIVTGIREIGWPQMGIDVPTLSAVNGAKAAAIARDIYGHHGRFALDIEPDEFRANPQAWKVAANQWCEDVHNAGLIPGIYGTDETVALCSDHADFIWRAKPDMCDPAGPGLDPNFFIGRRAVQCAQGTFAGLVCDINYAQFALSVTSPIPVEVPVDMASNNVIQFGGQLHLFYTAKGVLQHRWYGGTGSGWGQEVVPGSPVFMSGECITTDVYGGQLHVFVPQPDGAMSHMWYGAGTSGGWQVEVL